MGEAAGPSTDELELVRTARRLLAKYYRPGSHHIVCALQCRGNIYPALHLNSSGRDVCAEPVALANAILAGENRFDRIVAVASGGPNVEDGIVVPPCGDCRQILLEYAPEVMVLLTIEGGLTSASAVDLLPHPYAKPLKGHFE